LTSLLSGPKPPLPSRFVFFHLAAPLSPAPGILRGAGRAV